jgi:hypothetical protein
LFLGAVLSDTEPVTLLQVGYVFHELVFALLYLSIVAILFRQGRLWACWAVGIANFAYLLTFRAHDLSIFYRAFSAAVALPALLLSAAPWFFSGRSPTAPAG